VNVSCAISIQKVYGPFFFVEDTVNANRYLDMVQQWLMPQLQEDSDSFRFSAGWGTTPLWPGSS
jgi:hypothetical protein